MTLTSTDTTMSSDQTAHTARLAPGSQHLWEVSWLPGKALDRNSAMNAMIVADLASDLNERHHLWPFIQSWAAGARPDRVQRDQPGLPARHPSPAARPRKRAARPRGGTMTSPTPPDHDRKPEPADVPRRILGPASLGDDSAAAVSQDPHSGRLAYSVDEAAHLTGLSRDLLYDEMRRGNLASVKVGGRRLITRQHLQQFLGIAS